jgi:hypothetical protein
MTDAMLDARTQRRQQLRARGYMPIPLFGKQPPEYGKNNQRGGLAGWSKLTDVSHEQINMWSRVWPTATNTGALAGIARPSEPAGELAKQSPSPTPERRHYSKTLFDGDRPGLVHQRRS